ncbi:MAG: DoxX family protein [Nocardioidaceae bacterium]
MFTALIVVSALLAALLGYAAVRKLSHRPEVVASYARVGVPEDKLDYLAAILIVGAAGLVAGLAWAPLGVVAATALVVYFALAIGAHLRARDFANTPTPVLMILLAGAASALRIATL